MNQADILIHNAMILTMDAQNTILSDAALAISNDTIVAIGEKDLFSGWQIGQSIDARQGIVMPGLVNTHTHASMTCFRGLADDLPLMTWLNDHIFPAEAKLDADMVYKGALLACAEMILTGTTCFCDMYLFEDAVAKAAKHAGMRAVVGEVLYDFPSPHYGDIEQGFAFTEKFIQAWADDPLITVAVEPHSPYLCAPSLLTRAYELTQAYHAPLVIHVSESQSEVETIQGKYGCTPVRHLADLGALAPNLLACHCVVLSDDDIKLLKDHDVKVSHNPESNMKLASGIAPVPRLLEKGVCVGLGSDGCASNNNLDIFLEMDTAAKLHKVNTFDPTVMDALTMVRMSTINGAKALGMDSITGSLEPGKKADIIIIDTHKPHLTPMYNPYSHLVYSARGSDVDTTIINGQIIMQNRQILSFDVEQAMSDINIISKTIKGNGNR